MTKKVVHYKSLPCGYVPLYPPELTADRKEVTCKQCLKSNRKRV